MDHSLASGEAIQKVLHGSMGKLPKHGNDVLHGCVDWPDMSCKKSMMQKTHTVQMMKRDRERKSTKR